MKENIRFRGLTLNRDEQSAEHGELALCAGVEMHDGALRASVLQGSMVQHEETSGGETTMVDSELKVGNDVATLLYVHEASTYRHFITKVGNLLYWFKDDGTQPDSPASPQIQNFTSNTIISVTSIGNTLIVMTSTGVHYILWKDTDYKYLGTEFPFVRLQFRPTENKEGDYDRSTLRSVHTEFVQDPQRYDAWRSVGEQVYANAYVDAEGKINVADIKNDEGQQSAVTEAVWALINQTNNTIAKDGHFYAPFMIRYCYRLYDGSMVMHSAPVFMDVSLPLTYKVYSPNVRQRTSPDDFGFYPIIVNGDDILMFIRENDTGDPMFDTNWFTLRYRPNNVGISFKLANDAAWNTLKDWSDIVMSVDIFVTPPVTREDSSQIIKRMIVENPQYGVRGSNLETWSTTYNHWENSDKTYAENLIFEIPKLSDEAYLDKILGQNTFYKIKSFNLEDKPSTSWTEMDYDKSIIPYIAAQEQMTDDYKTHNKLLPLTVGNSGMYVYNHRLNVYGIQERLFAGFSIGDMVNQCSGSNTVTVTKVMVELNTESGKKYVENDISVSVPEYILCNTPLFYPDSRAVRIVIYYTSGGTARAVSFNMEACALLNGAITMPQFLQQRISGSVAANTITYDVSDLVPMPNKVYTSEADNPFYFPLNGINTIGTGSIIGIAAVTRALSQGQVGDHDLIVFATDGIWVMKVSSTGTYSAMHNISREVCSWKDSICQLDQSVTFATKRALSRFVESDIIPMSEELDGPVPKWIPDAVQQQSAPLLQSSPRRSASNSYIGVRLFTELASPISITIEHDISLLDNASTKELIYVIGTASEPSIEKFFLRGHRLGDAADVKVYFDQNWTFDGHGIDDYNDPNTGHPRTDTAFYRYSNGHYYAYVDHGSYYTFDDLGTEDPTQGNYITPSVNSLSFAQAGETKIFGISSNVSWAISKSSGSDWLTVSPDNGSNDDTISVVAAANPDANSRTATLTISGGSASATVSISQAGTTPTPPGPEPPTPTPGDGLLPDLAVFFANNPEILRLLRFGTPAVDMFNSGKVVYDHAGMRVMVLPHDMSNESVALVWSTRDRTWSTMNIPALKAVVAGYPYPFVQDSDGKVMILDKPYGYESGAGSEKPGLIITRTLTFSDTMDVLRGFLHYSDSEKAPTIFLYGSNDQRTWKPLGRTNRWFYNYLPGHPFRWFRLAVYMEMKPSEEYQQLELEFINKFAKL